MTQPRRTDRAASVRARLLTLAKERKEEFQFVLTRYAVERLLERLGRSAHRDRFVLKGAMLFVLWQGQLHRPTRDLDLLGYGSPELDQASSAFREICAVPADDGLAFDLGAMQASRIQEDGDYEGVRLSFQARLAGARIPLQVDIGFGDAVVPGPELAVFPVLLPQKAPRVRVYPRETVVAEKLHAMVVLDIRNSRMKDFFDLGLMAREFAFEGQRLRAAIVATFARRGTPVPGSVPFALTTGFLSDAGKAAQWTGFVKRMRFHATAPSLVEVGEPLRDFIVPVLADEVSRMQWPPGGPWRISRA